MNIANKCNIEERIRILESHKNYLKDRTGFIYVTDSLQCEITDAASCVFFKHQGTFYILTVGHFLAMKNPKNICLAIESEEPVPLLKPFVRGQYETVNFEEKDGGWLELADCSIPQNKKFIEIEQIETEKEYVPSELSFFAIHGYPKDFVNRDLDCELGLKGFVLRLDPDFSQKAHPNNLYYKYPNISYLARDKGSPTPLPHGMSGGGIWEFHLENDSCSVLDIKLIGLCSMWNEEDSIKVTRANVCLSLFNGL